ncbi:multisubunit sodium/proton antiporter, MrpD subunit [Peptoclostridium litorale DSM 5388]|uniref:NADH-quinone oxidoreductase subunit N n=1 Tax=Peptoclostridium litorale DSM 5388 TaxID=1121324 RepID=A0A069RBX5_PEPLI|nr:proton-conducting transporter membrane subunit [Peptoclostridium litorale]KDR94569.1 NADH-quinone oxidoreductase subunit N [Peptoclostridium litorale DSM 5388]SIO31526.1 multisubunit sodium/proton antiporter, MrpD subunit [Peptoclostridium litorale DSM 5388]
MEYFKSFPMFIVLIPFMSSFLMPMVKGEKTAKAISFAVNFVCLTLAALTFYYVSVNGMFKYDMGHFKAPWGIEFKVGVFESAMACIFTLVAFLAAWHSILNVQKDIPAEKMPIYYLVFNVFNASICGMTFTNDIFNAYVFIEVSTLAACGMIVAKDRAQNINAAIKYLVYSSLGSGLILMGIAFIYSITGNLNMDFIGIEISKVYREYRGVAMAALGLLTIGIGIKGAMFPFHVWLADAHSSATDVTSAVISAVGLKGPAILLIKVFHTAFGAQIIRESGVLDIVIALGSAGMIMGSVFAVFQDNIKKMVAYSSIAQMGYVFFGVGLGNTLGFVISIVHMMGHALTKSAMFLSVGLITEKTNTYSIKGMSGIGRRMPLPLGVFALGALSMIGIPILPGFVSKWNLCMASIESKRTGLVAVVLISSILNCLYYIPVLTRGYFKCEAEFGNISSSCKSSLANSMQSVLLVVAMVTLGIFSGRIIELLTLDFSNII